jgi:LmbE family N-acetylglucosaminyl deacetylase
MGVDVLAIGAHPDDVDLTCGGTLAKLASRGKSAAILDLTRGEMATRGTPETRAEESFWTSVTAGWKTAPGAGGRS